MQQNKTSFRYKGKPDEEYEQRHSGKKRALAKGDGKRLRILPECLALYIQILWVSTALDLTLDYARLDIKK